MEIINIQSHEELKKQLEKSRATYLLLYKNGSDQSNCALDHLKGTDVQSKDIQLLVADVSFVRDIHTNYNVTTVPSLLEFEGAQYKNVLKGCHDKSFYKNYFENIIYELKAGSNEKPAKRVTVYTTPSCPWCTTLKNFLKKNGIRFTEVDVAGDENAAKEMVSKSGQQGVPQADINGEMVIGFDQTKLNRLLEIK